MVYVGVIAPAHKEMVKLMLNNKKAVLCEKPLGLSLAEVKFHIMINYVSNISLGDRDGRAGKDKKSFLHGGSLEPDVPHL